MPSPAGMGERLKKVMMTGSRWRISLATQTRKAWWLPSSAYPASAFCAIACYTVARSSYYEAISPAPSPPYSIGRAVKSVVKHLVVNDAPSGTLVDWLSIVASAAKYTDRIETTVSGSANSCRIRWSRYFYNLTINIKCAKVGKMASAFRSPPQLCGGQGAERLFDCPDSDLRGTW